MRRSDANGQDDAYLVDAGQVARELREAAADQLHDLVVEREGLGSIDEIGRRVQNLVVARRRLWEARGRQGQAEAFGNPVAPHVKAEREALEMLRQSLMSLGEACGSAVVGLDFERVRPRIEAAT